MSCFQNVRHFLILRGSSAQSLWKLQRRAVHVCHLDELALAESKISTASGTVPGDPQPGLPGLLPLAPGLARYNATEQQLDVSKLHRSCFVGTCQKPRQYDNFAQLGLPFAALGDLLYQYPLHERTFSGDTGETLNLTKARHESQHTK